MCLEEDSLWDNSTIVIGALDVYHFQNSQAEVMVVEPICLGLSMIVSFVLSSKLFSISSCSSLGLRLTTLPFLSFIFSNGINFIGS